MAEKKFKIIAKSDNFIYFVTQCDESADWHFKCRVENDCSFVFMGLQ